MRKNQTDAEKKLWKILQDRQLNNAKFRRQFSICGYILDFYCPQYKLGIEADGGQHFENKGELKDKARTEKLLQKGVKIIRFSNLEILKNIEGVYEKIYEMLENLKVNPSPQPSPHRGEGVKAPQPFRRGGRK